MKKSILILNGPNLNMLGIRQPDIYGHISLDDIVTGLQALFADIEIKHCQSNHEGALIDAIHSTHNDKNCLGIVLNAGAYTHTSLALADAIAAVSTPVVEVHLSNTAAREPIRRTSLIAPVCIGSITGFAADSYRLAIQALLLRN